MSRLLAWLRFEILLSAGALVIPGCSRAPEVPGKPAPVSDSPAKPDPSVVVSDTRPVHHGNSIENGEAYDQAALDVEKYKKVILPDTAEVRREGKGKKLEVFMKKHLGFHGFPPGSMSIRTARKNMGCAVREEDGSLVLATFGEWDSHIEGGASMGLVVLVLEGVTVEQRDGLSGEASKGREWNGAYLTKPKEVNEGWWYGPASPAEGWKAIPDVPDPKRRAVDAKYPPPIRREGGR